MINTNLTIYPAREFKPKDFAILIESISPQASGILYGCEVSIKNPTTIFMKMGWALVRGRLVQFDAGDISVALSSNGTQTRYLVLKIDLSNSSNPAELVILTSVPSDSSKFNESDGIAYLKMATFTTSTTTISNIINEPLLSRGINTSELIATVELEEEASKKYEPGELYIKDGKLYMVLTPIENGHLLQGFPVTVSSLMKLNTSRLSMLESIVKPIVINHSLLSSEWSSINVQQITNSNIKYDSLVFIAPSDGITIDQLKAYQSAMILGFHQTQGSIALKAHGKKPTIDIPIKVIISYKGGI